MPFWGRRTVLLCRSIYLKRVPWSIYLRTVRGGRGKGRTLLSEFTSSTRKCSAMIYPITSPTSILSCYLVHQRLRNNDHYAMKTAPSFCLFLSSSLQTSHFYCSSIKPRLFSAIKSYTINMSDNNNNNINNNNAYEQDGAEAKEIAKYLRK